MIGWTGVPLDPRILADGYYDGEGNWVEDYSYTDTSIDTDGDGLSDYDESYIYGTDTLLTDTDGDGISDYDEVHTYFTSPTVFDGAPVDSDGDGLPDTDEIDFYGTDPWSSDTDSDGMSDYDEITSFFTNPTVSDSPWSSSSPQDSDGDGLTDSDESSYGTDPWSADSDGDGYSDYEEVITSYTNPLDSSSNGGSYSSGSSDDPSYGTTGYGDSDGDGLSDYEEVSSFFTDPSIADTDGDGHSDGAEVIAGTNPLDASSSPSSGESGPDSSNGADSSTPPQESSAPPAPAPISTVSLSQAIWFRVHGIDPNDPTQLGADLDGDGLTLQQEYTHKTNPRLADTDGDGLSDGLETVGQSVETIDYGHASSYASSHPGIDPVTGETLPVEIPSPPVFTSDPTMVDTDGDGYSDFWEWTYRTDTRNPFDLVVNDEWSLPTEFAYQQSWMNGYGDEDGDGLSNGAEFFHSTDPFSSDTDGDGLWDTEEIHGAIAYGTTETPGYYDTTSYWDTDPATGESIELTTTYWVEGYSSSYEYTLATTDPTKADTDGDGFDDGYEILHGMNPNGASDGMRDGDGDGLTAWQEMLLGTSDEVPNGDLDGDGLPDAIELGSWSVLLEALGLPGLDPLDPADGAADYDGDGLSNAEEYALGTDFLVADTDGDGVSDGVEVVEGTDPLAPLSQTIADGDEENSEATPDNAEPDQSQNTPPQQTQSSGGSHGGGSSSTSEPSPPLPSTPSPATTPNTSPTQPAPPAPEAPAELPNSPSSPIKVTSRTLTFEPGYFIQKGESRLPDPEWTEDMVNFSDGDWLNWEAGHPGYTSPSTGGPRPSGPFSDPDVYAPFTATPSRQAAIELESVDAVRARLDNGSEIDAPEPWAGGLKRIQETDAQDLDGIVLSAAISTLDAVYPKGNDLELSFERNDQSGVTGEVTQTWIITSHLAVGATDATDPDYGKNPESKSTWAVLQVRIPEGSSSALITVSQGQGFPGASLQVSGSKVRLLPKFVPSVRRPEPGPHGELYAEGASHGMGLLPVEFEGEPHNGFDDTVVPKWQSAPENGDTRTVYFKTSNPDLFEFKTNDPSVATVSANAAENGRIPLEISGKGKGEAELQAVLKDTGQVALVMMIDVLPRIEKSLTVWWISNSIPTAYEVLNGTVVTWENTLDPGPIPTSGMVEDYLNDHWGRVANIHFTVKVEDGLSYYDRNPIDGKMSQFEAQTHIRTNHKDTGQNHDPESEKNFYVVKTFHDSISTRLGYLPNTGHNIGYIQTTENTNILNVIAHEIGHAVGRAGHVGDDGNGDAAALMYREAYGGREIRRSDRKEIHEYQSSLN